MRRSDLGPEFEGAVVIAPGSAWLKQLPEACGIYVVALAKPFPRLSGETDIVYIGQAGKADADRRS